MEIKQNQTIVLSDGRKLGYAEYGDPNGQPLLYFHGWPSSRFQADILDKPAKKLQIRIISLDRPGYGLSSFKKNRTLLDYPDEIVEVADKLGIKKFAVVGVSGGGPYAAVVAYKIPERLTKAGIVVGLAPTNIDGVLEGMALFNKLAWRSYHKFPFLMDISSSIHLSQARKILPDILSFAYRSQSDRKQMSKRVKADMIRTRNEAFRQGKEGVLRDLQLYISNWDFDLKAIKTNVLLWYGGADRNVSINMGKYYASHIPNAKLTVYPNEGHFLIRNHAEEILRSLIS